MRAEYARSVLLRLIIKPLVRLGTRGTGGTRTETTPHRRLRNRFVFRVIIRAPGYDDDDFTYFK